jgi:hypothetical protein
VPSLPPARAAAKALQHRLTAFTHHTEPAQTNPVPSPRREFGFWLLYTVISVIGSSWIDRTGQILGLFFVESFGSRLQPGRCYQGETWSNR